MDNPAISWWQETEQQCARVTGCSCPVDTSTSPPYVSFSLPFLLQFFLVFSGTGRLLFGIASDEQQSSVKLACFKAASGNGQKKNTSSDNETIFPLPGISFSVFVIWAQMLARKVKLLTITLSFPGRCSTSVTVLLLSAQHLCWCGLFCSFSSH